MIKTAYVINKNIIVTLSYFIIGNNNTVSDHIFIGNLNIVEVEHLKKFMQCIIKIEIEFSLQLR